MRTDLETVQNELNNWWHFGPQDKMLTSAKALKENHPPLPDTDDLKRYWTDVDFILQRTMQVIDHSDYYGVSVPFHYVDFSAVAMPCALGGRIEYVNKDTIWSHPVCSDLEEILELKLTEENVAYKAQIEAMRRSVKRAKNHHYVSPWSLGGILDTISGLYGAENLLMDLILRPDLVKKVVNYLTALWLEEFRHITELIGTSGNQGHVCGWVGIWAPGTTFPIQEDFAYMISPDMFKEFCLPSIRQMIEAMDYPLFHLDGQGMLPHLDMLLEIEELKAIQWQPGAGKERLDQWYPVIQKILAAGKSCQVFAEAAEIDDLERNVGHQGMLAILRNAN